MKIFGAAVHVLKRDGISEEIGMSNPSIRIVEDVSFPEIEVANDIGTSIDIGSIDALDMGLLVNSKKLNSPGRTSSPGVSAPAPSVSFSSGLSEMKSDDIEFVNLEEVGSNTMSLNLNPTATTTAPEPIRIVRDTTPAPPKPFGYTSTPGASQPPAPAPTRNWFSSTPAEPVPEENKGGIGQTFRNWFGGSGTTTTEEPAVVRTMEYLTPEQEFIKKTEQLTLLERMDKRGIMGNKMTIANTLEEITAEVERRKDSKALEASLRFQRSMLTTVTNGMEFLNSRFDPFGVKLDGWSEQINENIEDYDEIFEELYDKYKDKSKVAPEVRLIMSLGLSAAMCHVTNTMFKSKMPGMDDILRNNPDLARQFAQAAAQEAVGPGFANFVGMGMNSRRPSVQPQMPPPQMPSYNSMFAAAHQPPSPMQQPQTARREMRGPSGVEDILQKLNQAGEGMPDRAVPPPASPQIDAEEVHSVRSGFTTETARLSGRSRRKTTTQPVGATLTLNV